MRTRDIGGRAYRASGPKETPSAAGSMTGSGVGREDKGTVHPRALSTIKGVRQACPRPPINESSRSPQSFALWHIQHQQNLRPVPDGTRWYAVVRGGTRDRLLLFRVPSSRSQTLLFLVLTSGTRWYAMVREGADWEGQ